MRYTKIRAATKWWEPHTKKPKDFSSITFDEHNNTYSKVWQPGSKLMLGKNTSTLPTLKITYKIIPSSNIIYLKSILISRQYVLLLVLLHNTVNIRTCHIYPSQQTISHGIMPYY